MNLRRMLILASLLGACGGDTNDSELKDFCGDPSTLLQFPGDKSYSASVYPECVAPKRIEATFNTKTSSDSVESIDYSIESTLTCYDPADLSTIQIDGEFLLAKESSFEVNASTGTWQETFALDFSFREFQEYRNQCSSLGGETALSVTAEASGYQFDSFSGNISKVDILCDSDPIMDKWEGIRELLIALGLLPADSDAQAIDIANLLAKLKENPMMIPYGPCTLPPHLCELLTELGELGYFKFYHDGDISYVDDVESCPVVRLLDYYRGDSDLDTWYHLQSVPQNWSEPNAGNAEIFAYGFNFEGSTPVIVFNDDVTKSSHKTFREMAHKAINEQQSMVFVDRRGTGCSTLFGAITQGDSLNKKNIETFVQTIGQWDSKAAVFDAEKIREHLGLDQWQALGFGSGAMTVHRYLETKPEKLIAAHAFGNMIGTSYQDRYFENLKVEQKLGNELAEAQAETALELNELQKLVVETSCEDSSGFENSLFKCSPKLIDHFVAPYTFDLEWESLAESVAKLDEVSDLKLPITDDMIEIQLIL